MGKNLKKSLKKGFPKMELPQKRDRYSRNWTFPPKGPKDLVEKSQRAPIPGKFPKGFKGKNRPGWKGNWVFSFKKRGQRIPWCGNPNQKKWCGKSPFLKKPPWLIPKTP